MSFAAVFVVRCAVIAVALSVSHFGWFGLVAGSAMLVLLTPPVVQA